MELSITTSSLIREMQGGKMQAICIVGQTASTITTRYGAICTTNLISTAHFPMTAVLIEHEI